MYDAVLFQGAGEPLLYSRMMFLRSRTARPVTSRER